MDRRAAWLLIIFWISVSTSGAKPYHNKVSFSFIYKRDWDSVLVSSNAGGGGRGTWSVVQNMTCILLDNDMARDILLSRHETKELAGVNQQNQSLPAVGEGATTLIFEWRIRHSKCTKSLFGGCFGAGSVGSSSAGYTRGGVSDGMEWRMRP